MSANDNGQRRMKFSFKGNSKRGTYQLIDEATGNVLQAGTIWRNRYA